MGRTQHQSDEIAAWTVENELLGRASLSGSLDFSPYGQGNLREEKSSYFSKFESRDLKSILQRHMKA